MLVKHITVTVKGDRHVFQGNLDDFYDAIVFALDEKAERIAFGGMTGLGRAGIVIEIPQEEISGHKIDPIPRKLLNLAEHFPLTKNQEGLCRFSEGRDIYLYSPNGQYELLLRWLGKNCIEIFGTGRDSETLSSGSSH